MATLYSIANSDGSISDEEILVVNKIKDSVLSQAKKNEKRENVLKYLKNIENEKLSIKFQMLSNI